MCHITRLHPHALQFHSKVPRILDLIESSVNANSRGETKIKLLETITQLRGTSAGSSGNSVFQSAKEAKPTGEELSKQLDE